MRGLPCRRVIIACGLLALALPVEGAQEPSLVYRQRTGSEEVRIEIREQSGPDGGLLEASMSNGESYRIESGAEGTVRACAFDFPADRTSWKARREGATLRLEGTVRGRPVSRAFPVGSHPWYESAEHSLQSYALTGSRAPLLFWMIQPYDGHAYLMAARVDRRELIEVDGESREGVRLVVRPAGLLAFLWNSTYWYDPSDGTFLRSESLRGLLARFPTLIELVEDRRPGRGLAEAGP